MTLTTYASLRSTTPGVTFSATSGGSLSGSGSIWLSVQARNRVGKNLLSTATQVNYSSGQKIVVTFGSAARATGEEIFEYVISAGTTSTLANMKQIAAWRAKNSTTISSVAYPAEGSNKSLPATLELTTDAQIAICPTVTNAAGLPTTGMLYGAMRFISSTSQYVRYDDLATSGIQAASSGYWVISSQAELETYLSSTTSSGGCDRPLAALTSSGVFYVPPPYSGTGSNSHPVRFWVSNGLNTSGIELPQGTRIQLQLSANGRDVSAAFSGRVLVNPIGIVDRSTGVLTTVSGSGSYTTWYESTPLELPQALPAGSAIAYEIVFKYLQAEIASIVTTGTRVLLNIFIEGLLGYPDSTWAITGDTVLEIGNKLRLIPVSGGFRRLSGVCLVKGYRTPFVGTADYGSLSPDTTGLKAAISASLAGAIVVRGPSDALFGTEALRALVGTASGTQTPSNTVSVTTTSGNPAISLTINYPSSVRLDYPDVVAGTAAEFNVPRVYIYLTLSGTTYRLPAIIPTAPSQTVLVTSLSGATTVGSLPSSASNFGLFGYGTITATANNASSTLTNGAWTVRIAYHYPSPNTAVSSISHATVDGCIPELEPLQDAIDNASTIYTGSTAPSNGTGDTGDVYIEANSGAKTITVYRKNSPSSWTSTGSITSVDGVDGDDGVPGYSVSAASYVQPAVGNTVAITVNQTQWVVVNAIIFVEGGGYYQVTAKTTSTITAQNLGYAENTSVSSTIATGKIIFGAGPRGAAGAGAYTTTTADYVQPATSSTVQITVGSTAWMAVGQIIFIQSGGSYSVYSIDSALLATVTNLGYSGSASASSTVTSGKKVVASGAQGAAGSSGGGGLSGNSLNTTTTADFTQPAASSTVQIDVVTTTNFESGLQIYITGGGIYIVSSVDSSTQLTIENTGATGNAAEFDTISTGATVSASAPIASTAYSLFESPSGLSETGFDRGKLYMIDDRIKFTTGVYPETNGYVLRMGGDRTVWLPACDWYPSVTAGCGAMTSLNPGSSFPALRGLQFSGTADQSAEILIFLPLSLDPTKTITYGLYWTSDTSSSNTCDWEIANTAWKGDRVITNSAWGTASSFSSSSMAAQYEVEEVLNSGNSIFFANVPSGSNPASSHCALALKLTRKGATDSLADPAYFLGLRLIYQINKPNDRNIW